MDANSKQSLPDIAQENSPELPGQLNWVGMGNIEVPVRVQTKEGENILTPASVDAFVSLDDPKAKGIHMSRVFLLAQETLTSEILSIDTLSNLLTGFIHSQGPISQSSRIVIRFQHMTRRPALQSEILGWRAYPITVAAEKINGEVTVELSTTILYSSTCPCSAALARQLIQQQFTTDFSNKELSHDSIREWLGSSQGIIATPHSQRSEAKVTVKLAADSTKNLPVEELIDQIEGSLQTPVQAAVKREDEQEFARLNGSNAMFCEDAARKVRSAMESEARYLDYLIRVEHLESLHAHDAVSVVTKGIENGFTAE